MAVRVSNALPFDAGNSRFVSRVEQRRNALDLAVLFYTHLAEVTAWLESLRRHMVEDLNFSSGTPSLDDAQVRGEKKNKTKKNVLLFGNLVARRPSSR